MGRSVVSRRRVVAVGVLVAIALLTACGSSKGVSVATDATTSTTTPATTNATTTTAAPTTTQAPSSTATPTTEMATTTPAAGSGGVTLDATADVAAGEKFDVKWTGPAASGDYVTIVAAGTEKWTDEPYFRASPGASPGSLVAPVKDGAYVLWYVSGADDTILARKALTVTPFEGALGAPAEVEAGTNFDVAWNGPNGPGDYVTIVAAGTEKWTDEPYFYTANANPGTLVAPLDAGSYVVWYVTGSDSATMATRPITVTPYSASVKAAESVQHGTQFDVTWTGPDGPGDYITIVPAGSPPGTYLSYTYTRDGNPVHLTAPDAPGDYEIWYASDRVQNVVLAKTDISVT